MTRLLNRLGGALLLTLPLMAHAGSAGEDYRITLPPNPAGALPVITRLYSQNLLFFVPTRFVRAQASAGEGQYLRGYVPAGETAQHWTQMITLTATRDATGENGMTPRGLLAKLAQRYQRTCPGTFAAADLGETVISGFPAQVAAIGCGRAGKQTPAQGEQTVIIAIQGEKDMYTLQWAERTAPAKTPPRLDLDRLQAHLTELMPVRVCSPGSAELPFADCLRTPPEETQDDTAATLPGPVLPATPGQP